MFTIRFNEEEIARLEKVAHHYGLTWAAAIRMLLRREEDAIDAAAAPRAPPSAERKPRKR